MSKKLTRGTLLARLRQGPQRNTYWRHYRTGDLYRVERCVIAEATQEVLVVYYPFRDRGSGLLHFARPLAEWTEVVEHEGRSVARFTREG